MTHLLVIDGNNIGYASLYVPMLANMSHEGFPTGGIIGTAQSVMRVVTRTRHTQAVPVVVWDGRAAWREALYPGYKQNRNKTPEQQAVRDSWHRQKPHAQRLLHALGIPQLRNENTEADDLAGRLCQDAETLARYGIDRITLVSNDQDWWQALAPHIDLFTTKTQTVVTLETLSTPEVKDGPFANPEEYLTAKTWAGDKSDGIDGVPSIGLKTAVKLLQTHGTLEALCEAVTAGQVTDKRSHAVAAHVDRIQRNRRLMDWRQAPPLLAGSSGLWSGAYDADSTRSICAEFGLTKLWERLQSERWAKLTEKWDRGSLMALAEDVAGVSDRLGHHHALDEEEREGENDLLRGAYGS